MINAKPNFTLPGAEPGVDAHAEAAFAALYSELHRLARSQLSRCALPISMSATTLLHMSFIDIAERSGPSFPDRPRFIGYVARVMRGLIIDHVRNRRAEKRGGSSEIVSYTPDVKETVIDNRELLLLSEALDELVKMDAKLAEVVNLKFFGGFSFAEIAAMQNISERTVQRAWEKARIYLHQSIRPDLLF